MIIFYLISIIFAIIASFTSNLGLMIAAVIVAGVATFADKIGR